MVLPQFGFPVHGFLLLGGVFTTIDFPGAIATAAYGINTAGDIVGQYTDSSGKTHAFLRSKRPDRQE